MGFHRLITQQLLSLEIASLHIAHERTKTSNRLRRDGEMTIAIPEMPISIKLTFRPSGLLLLVFLFWSCVYFATTTAIAVIYCHSVPASRWPRRSPAHGPSKDQGEQDSHIGFSKCIHRHQSRLEWGRTPPIIPLPARQGTRGKGERVDLRSQAEARPARLPLLP